MYRSQSTHLGVQRVALRMSGLWAFLLGGRAWRPGTHIASLSPPSGLSELGFPFFLPYLVRPELSWHHMHDGSCGNCYADEIIMIS